jgi:cell division protein FtsB
MSHSRPPNNVSFSQIAAAACWVFGIFILIVLAQKVTTTAVLWQQREALQHQIQDLYTEKDRLLEKRDYVQSKDYIEEVARHDMKLGKPGETAVIGVPAPAATPAPTAAPAAPPR